MHRASRISSEVSVTREGRTVLGLAPWNSKPVYGFEALLHEFNPKVVIRLSTHLRTILLVRDWTASWRAQVVEPQRGVLQGASRLSQHRSVVILVVVFHLLNHITHIHRQGLDFFIEIREIRGN